MSAYVMLSRAKFLENMWILRHVSPSLFSVGPPAMPRLLMQKLRAELTPQEAMEELKRFRAQDAAQEIAAKKKRVSADDDAMKRLYRCTQCFLTKQQVFEFPPPFFGANAPSEILDKILRHGAWARCTTCQTIAAAKAGRSGAASRTTGAVSIADDGLQCTQCKELRPHEYFKYETLHKWERNKRHVCNV